MNGELDKDAIIGLLSELGDRLHAKGVDARFYVVGGAAMLLAYGRETMTRDIDAIFEPKTVVYEEARLMASEREWLGDDWLNDGVKGFIRGPDPDVPAVILAAPGISVEVASPKRLLAMKVAAARVGRDVEDIILLAREVGVSSIDEVLDIAFAEYGDLLEARSRFVVIEALQDVLPRRAEPMAPLALTGSVRVSSRHDGSGPCGARTAAGTPCQNPAGSCPHHR